jgi:hypothetical protein
VASSLLHLVDQLDGARVWQHLALGQMHASARRLRPYCASSVTPAGRLLTWAWPQRQFPISVSTHYIVPLLTLFEGANHRDHRMAVGGYHLRLMYKYDDKWDCSSRLEDIVE